MYTVKPLLRDHPQGNGKWPLINRGKNNRRNIIRTLLILDFWPPSREPLNIGSTVY